MERAFVLRTALHLGFPTVRHFLAAFDITSRELTELIALRQLEPDTGDRVDYAGALVAAVIANANSTKQKRFKLSDFAPPWKREPEKPAEVMDIVRMLRGK